MTNKNPPVRTALPRPNHALIYTNILIYSQKNQYSYIYYYHYTIFLRLAHFGLEFCN